jgi:hypothetical protein
MKYKITFVKKVIQMEFIPICSLNTYLTLLRDGQLKAEQEMTGGLLPSNGDWVY